MDHLGKRFNRYFTTIKANTPALLDDAMQLRFQVYCIENGFEDRCQFEGEREFDSYDLHSVHSIIRYANNDHTAATTRLILPRKEQNGIYFPIQAYIENDQFQSMVPDWDVDDIHSFAEISRFCVSKEFKNRFSESNSLAGTSDYVDANRHTDQLNQASGESEPVVESKCDARMLPHLTIGLMAAIFEMSAEENLKYWFALMEPSLLRLLGRFGIEFMPIGEVVEHHGVRQPCCARIDDIALGIWQKRPDVWRFVTRNGEVWPLPEQEDLKIVSAG